MTSALRSELVIFCDPRIYLESKPFLPGWFKSFIASNTFQLVDIIAFGKIHHETHHWKVPLFSLKIIFPSFLSCFLLSFPLVFFSYLFVSKSFSVRRLEIFSPFTTDVNLMAFENFQDIFSKLAETLRDFLRCFKTLCRLAETC